MKRLINRNEVFSKQTLFSNVVGALRKTTNIELYCIKLEIEISGRASKKSANDFLEAPSAYVVQCRYLNHLMDFLGGENIR